MNIDFNGLRFLIVDDSIDTRDLFAYLFSDRGARVVGVPTVKEAIEVWPKLQPDFVLCEPWLPGESAYSLPRRLQELPGGKQVVTIAVTKAARESDRLEALLAGFHAYIAKPVDLDELEALVAIFLLEGDTPRMKSATPTA